MLCLFLAVAWHWILCVCLCWGGGGRGWQGTEMFRHKCKYVLRENCVCDCVFMLLWWYFRFASGSVRFQVCVCVFMLLQWYFRFASGSVRFQVCVFMLFLWYFRLASGSVICWLVGGVYPPKQQHFSSLTKLPSLSVSHLSSPPHPFFLVIF